MVIFPMKLAPNSRRRRSSTLFRTAASALYSRRTTHNSRNSPLSALQSALPRVLRRNSFRIRTYKTSQIWIKTKDFNPFRIRTSEHSQHLLKTKVFKSRRIRTSTISQLKSFRIRTSEKRWGEGGKVLVRGRWKPRTFSPGKRAPRPKGLQPWAFQAQTYV